MKRILLIVGLVLGSVTYANAGCIGPVIMGECKGQVVPWDTHPNVRDREPSPAPPDSTGIKEILRFKEKILSLLTPLVGGMLTTRTGLITIPTSSPNHSTLCPHNSSLSEAFGRW